MLGHVIEKSFNGIHLSIALNGDYSITLPGFGLNDCRSGMCCPGDELPVRPGRLTSVDWKLCAESDDSVMLEGKNEWGDWRIQFSAVRNPGGVPGLEIGLTGELKKLVPDLLVVPLRIPVLPASHVLTQGIGMGDCESLLLPATKEFSSHYQTMITAGAHSLQVAFPLMQMQPGKVTGRILGKEVHDLQAGYAIKHFGLKRIALDPITLFASEDGIQLMHDYGSGNIEVKKDFGGHVASGWNTWDYYRWTITEEEVLKNAEFIARDPVLSRHVKRIIVDDGWQYCYGEWDANPLFPNGMAWLARELKKMGFVPGLWFAPAIVEPQARIAQLDSDMLAMGESGKPCLSFECMKRHGFILDPTVPKSRKYLSDLFRRYAGMGYEYFKLDFLGSALSARKFADAEVPRSQIVRKIVEPIHAAVQGKATILGCNYHFEAGNSLVDAVRVGGDIHATWTGIVHNAISVAARFWSNKRLWLNDPDFALCRSLDTSNDPDLTRLLCCTVLVTPEMIRAEAADFKLVSEVWRGQMELLLSVVLAAGGAVNLSDNLPRLNASGLDLARRVVSADSGDAAIPLDLFRSELPATWLQRVGKYHRLLVANWTDEPAVHSFDFQAHHIAAKTAVNFWNDQAVPMIDGVIRVELPPRSCLLAVINRS
jgi:hypothetical protein